MNPPARPQLLGFWMCVALVVGNTIGSGVFLLPASLAPYGLNSIVAWGFTSAGALLPLSVGATTAAATQTLWALLGLESASIPASKVRDPGRDISRATLLGTAVTALICIIACTTVLLLVPPAQLAASNAPFVDLATRFWGDGAGKAIAVFAAIIGFGVLNGWILLQGELPNVLAKNSVFPRIFARDSSRLTPTFSLVFTGALVTILILMNYQKSMVKVFTFMALLSTTACLVLYALCSLALLELFWRGPASNLGRTVSIAVAAVLATIYSMWAIAGAGAEPMEWGAALFSAGAPVYWLSRRRLST